MPINVSQTKSTVWYFHISKSHTRFEIVCQTATFDSVLYFTVNLFCIKKEVKH